MALPLKKENGLKIRNLAAVMLFAATFLLPSLGRAQQTVTVSGAQYTFLGTPQSTTIDFATNNNNNLTFFQVSGGLQFVGLSGLHTSVAGTNADAVFLIQSGQPNSDIGVSLNGLQVVPLNSFRVSSLPIFDPTTHNYGYDSTHTNGQLFQFFAPGTSGKVQFLSSVANLPGSGGNANVFLQAVAPAPEPSGIVPIALATAGLIALIARRRVVCA